MIALLKKKYHNCEAANSLLRAADAAAPAQAGSLATELNLLENGSA